MLMGRVLIIGDHRRSSGTGGGLAAGRARIRQRPGDPPPAVCNRRLEGLSCGRPEAVFGLPDLLRDRGRERRHGMLRHGDHHNMLREQKRYTTADPLVNPCSDRTPCPAGMNA